MIITIAGKPAAGKGTLAQMLSKKLNFPHYSLGQMIRDAAQGQKMTLQEFDAWAKNNNPFDKKQKEMGETQDNFILESRLGWYFIPNSIKIFLTVDIDIATKRRFAEINMPGRAEKKQDTPQDVKKNLELRANREFENYDKMYGLKAYDMTDFDIIIDTTDMTKTQVLNNVLGAITKMGYKLPQTAKVNK